MNLESFITALPRTVTAVLKLEYLFFLPINYLHRAKGENKFCSVLFFIPKGVYGYSE